MMIIFFIFTTRPLDPTDVLKEGPVFAKESEEFILFPNPVSQTLYMDPLPVESTLTFTGADGRIHLVRTLQAWMGEMDVSVLPKGLHIVQRKTRNGPPEFFKILKLSR